MATKTGQKRALVILSILMSLTLLVTMSATPVLASSYSPEGPGKEDPKTKLKMYEAAKDAAAKAMGESPDYSEAYESGIGVHQDPAVFEKNFFLTPEQKQIAIERCLDATELLDDEMSDLEKYYMLALWGNSTVKYDSDFWPGGYDFDYYSHQWDAYGILVEHLGVCAGIAVTYANLCHAAGLPCKFVRCDKYLDHTINHIPDINGHSYYIDITENSFFMSQYSDWSFEPIDLVFSGIDEGARPSDGSFEYRKSKKDDSRMPAGIKDFYDGKWGEGDFKPVSFKKWYNEYALHKNTKKIFYDKYVEKGSGDGTYHAEYTDFKKYPAQPYDSRKGNITDIWFLNDFYQKPADIKKKIEQKEFDEQLLIISGLKENYDCDGENTEEVIANLENTIAEEFNQNRISIKYFPTLSEENKIVAVSKNLTNNTDYEVKFETYKEDTHEAVFVIKAKGEYRSESQSQFSVKVNTALVKKAPIRNRGLQYDGSSQELLDRNKLGEATNGTMVYGIGTKDVPPEEFSTEIPKATNAGAYYIWYKAIGDEKHFDSEPQRILQPATIAPQETQIIEEDRVIRVGDKVKLTPAIEQGLEATFSFRSSDKKIATVSPDGTVTGIAEGSATIMISATLKGNDPNYADPFEEWITITVVPKEEEKPVAVTYKNVSGDGNVWYRGSRTTSDFVFKRSADDASTIDRFTGITVDGKKVDEANYTKESGSVVIKLKPTYLETLALGDHTLKAQFNDGSASARFTVAVESDGGARTGDDSDPILWITLMIISLLTIVLGIALNRRRANSR